MCFLGQCRKDLIFKLFAYYCIVGLVGVFLSFDVILDTVPPLLEGANPRTRKSLLELALGLSTLVTSFFPAVLGTPQTVDIMKGLNAALFDIKFAGCVPLVLAVLALFRKEAPVLPKIFLVASITLPFTPANAWLYSRSTCIFGLGVAWLTVWMLMTLLREPPLRRWRTIGMVLGGMAAAWLIGSGIIAMLRHLIEPQLQTMLLSKLSMDKAGRAEWMVFRLSEFLDRSMVWHPYNLLTLFFISLGLYSCSRTHDGDRVLWSVPRLRLTRNILFALLLMISVFGELYLFSTTWVSYSNRPTPCNVCGELYRHQEWIHTLKQALGNGSIGIYDQSDFDYMQLNTPSAYGTRWSYGYETVTPRRLAPRQQSLYGTLDYAQAGISHILVPPNMSPQALSHWNKVIDIEEFGLYENPEFQSIYMAIRHDGVQVPLFASPSPSNFPSTVNRHFLTLPPGISELTIAISYHPGWSYSLDDGKCWQRVQRTENNAIRIVFPTSATSSEERLILRFKPLGILANLKRLWV